MNGSRRRPGSRRIASFGETVFATYTRLAQEHGAINLGQGFPDFDPPSFVLNAYREAATGSQQYAPVAGLPALTETVAAVHGELLGRQLDPVANVQVTVGATEALFAIMQAMVDPGDEVIIVEPFYDSYPANVVMAGGIPIYVPLEPTESGDWSLDLDAVRQVCSNRTRLLLLNTPHNPTGKVFGAEELDALIDLAESFNFHIVSDEVYEHIAFETHTPTASRPGGWNRTLSISSLGKTFSITGWKIGWAIGPEPLIQVLRGAHQWISFAVATPLQAAAATMLRQGADDGYFSEVRDLYLAKRERIVRGLSNSPFRPLVPAGSYFVIADASALGYPDDVALCLDLPKRARVAAIPPSAFYSEGHRELARHLVRFAFCKEDEALDRAGQRLQSLN